MRILLVSASLLLGACGTAGQNGGNQTIANESRATGNLGGEGIVILPPSETGTILGQCSRDAPAPGEDSWTPRPADIRQFEDALPRALQRSEMSNRTALRGAPNGWLRQYVGIVRGGRRYIYGSFVPRDMMKDAPVPQREPIVICDGGPSIFGAEYDVEGARITHLGFNGPPEPDQ